jgi:hypothetical protein
MSPGDPGVIGALVPTQTRRSQRGRPFLRHPPKNRQRITHPPLPYKEARQRHKLRLCERSGVSVRPAPFAGRTAEPPPLRRCTGDAKPGNNGRHWTNVWHQQRAFLSPDGPRPILDEPRAELPRMGCGPYAGRQGSPGPRAGQRAPLLAPSPVSEVPEKGWRASSALTAPLPALKRSRS